MSPKSDQSTTSSNPKLPSLSNISSARILVNNTIQLYCAKPYISLPRVSTCHSSKAPSRRLRQRRRSVVPNGYQNMTKVAQSKSHKMEAWIDIGRNSLSLQHCAHFGLSLSLPCRGRVYDIRSRDEAERRIVDCVLCVLFPFPLSISNYLLRNL